MSGADRPIWFAGDLADPMAAVIADALGPARPRLLDCPGDLPRPWPAVSAHSPGILVVHRATLGSTDAGRLAKLRGRLGPTRPVILCVGPQVRYADLGRWSPLVDLILPEATAAETIPRHVGIVAPSSLTTTGRDVAVASTNPELRATWGAICRAGGYSAVEVAQLEAAPPGMAALWDVPVLEPSWPARLASRAATGPVIASIGFLDRGTRELARHAGAAACLDMPADLADLMVAIDRVTGSRRDPAHAGIPAPSFGHQPSSRTKR